MECVNCGSSRVVYNNFEAFCTACGTVLEEVRYVAR
ncbi:MAG: hypothetical protein HY365_01745 [Candidatus Aenigmarchaeota archaeon]|nr:hypothetical protein [Candidatus Aenigmarchaeota archaeon]